MTIKHNSIVGMMFQAYIIGTCTVPRTQQTGEIQY